MTATKHTVHLVPPLFEQGAVDDFKKSGTTLAFALSPRDLSMAVYAPPNVRLAPQFKSRWAAGLIENRSTLRSSARET